MIFFMMLCARVSGSDLMEVGFACSTVCKSVDPPVRVDDVVATNSGLVDSWHSWSLSNGNITCSLKFSEFLLPVEKLVELADVFIFRSRKVT